MLTGGLDAVPATGRRAVAVATVVIRHVSIVADFSPIVVDRTVAAKLGLTGAAAAVAVDVVAVVALLAAINDAGIVAAGIAGPGTKTRSIALVNRGTTVPIVAGTMQGLKMTIVIATIAVVGIAVVALLGPGDEIVIDRPITADLSLAGAAATIAVGQVAVVALFGPVDRPVAAFRMAGVVAAVPADAVAVVAVFKRVHKAVETADARARERGRSTGLIMGAGGQCRGKRVGRTPRPRSECDSYMATLARVQGLSSIGCARSGGPRRNGEFSRVRPAQAEGDCGHIACARVLDQYVLDRRRRV